MIPADIQLPTRACHNCRKKRWKCDRSLPVCQKCLSSGSECLGYGKLFVWAQGVASRGKMMGKTFTEKDKPKEERQGQLPHCTPSKEVVESEPERQAALNMPSTALVKHLEPRDEVLQPTLMDPLVQDLTRNSRYYLYHYASQLCADMVVYDTPEQNPMRDLIPAISDYPVLLQVILANAALHVFNISRDTPDMSAYQQKKKRCLVEYYAAVSRYGGPLTSSYRDALVAKQQALSLLARDVAVVNESNIDLVLATILLFVNYDLIESGKDKWKVHMEGARKLIDRMGTPAYRPHAMSRLRLCLLSDFLVFYILGSTFNFTTTPNPFPQSIELDPILQYAETNNYLSCPAPLLRIMLKSFDLSEELTSKVQRQLKELVAAALSFDPCQWSHELHPASPTEDLKKRVRIASAHRAAVCIYLARFIPCTHPLLDNSSGSALVNLTELSDEIIHHISFLTPDDALFKSISWPLFLAGAEAEGHAQRTWIMNTLDEFYSVMYWGYIPTVKRVLDCVWTCKDRSPAGAPNCWVTEVKEMGTDILIA